MAQDKFDPDEQTNEEAKIQTTISISRAPVGDNI